LKVAHILENW